MAKLYPTPSPRARGPRGGKYPHHVVQSILVPYTHKDVRAHGLRGARAVAERYGGKHGGKVERTQNFYRFRQRDPRAMTPGSYITYTSPSGVHVVRALPLRWQRQRIRDNPDAQALAAARDAACREGADISLKDRGRELRVKGAFSASTRALLRAAGFRRESTWRMRRASPSRSSRRLPR